MTATPETTTTDTHHHFLTGLAQQGRYAHEFARAGRTQEALEHLEAIERLATAYRNAVHAEQPGVVANELAVQWQDDEGWWRTWGGSIPGLFLDEGKRLVKQARAALPDKKVRLVRQMTLVRIEELASEQAPGGGE
jgi:hypothetical protein